MARFVFQRGLLALPTLLGVAFIVFLMAQAVPGDPAIIYAGNDATQADIEAVRVRLGLDRPVHEQFLLYLGRLSKADLGQSTRNQRPVGAEIAFRLPATIELAAAAMLIATLIGVLAGILSAVWRNSLVDDILMVGALTGLSIPAFWLGLLLILLFSHQLGWLPASGRGGPIWSATGLHHLILPAITLALSPMAFVARLTRSGMIEILSQDYVRTAVSKGLAPATVVVKHAFRNAALPIVTFVGIQAGMLLANAVVVETVFAWPGLSRLVVTSVFARDWPMVQGAILVLALVFVLSNIIVDLSYAALDPRIRYG